MNLQHLRGDFGDTRQDGGHVYFSTGQQGWLRGWRQEFRGFIPPRRGVNQSGISPGVGDANREICDRTGRARLYQLHIQ